MTETVTRIDLPARDRKLYLLPFELALFAVIFWADGAGHIPLSKTPFLLLVAWASLRLRGSGWRSAGLNADRRWLALLGIGIAAGTAFWAFEFFVENPLLYRLTGRYPDLHTFDDLVGNIQLLAILLVFNLVFAGFGEEMVWRGYALPRVAEILSGSRFAWVASLVAVNAAFGLAHLYQGEAGMVQATVQGVLLGLLYLATGRNLLAPIAAHFTANTCDFVTIYLGLYPGMPS
jgi:membrane protease YdiL (CAAX protease family)